MALMRDIEKPAKTYNRSVRQASAAFTDSPEWDRAVSRGNAALDAVERAVRLWVEDNRPQPATGLCGTPSPDGRFVCVLEPHTNGVMHSDRTDADVMPNGRRMVWETPAELPCGFKRTTAVTVDCAACGYHFDETEFIHAFDSVEEAVDTVVGAGWDELRDGRVVCEDHDEKHEALRSEVGVVNDSDEA
jgi:hypothetical protein